MTAGDRPQPHEFDGGFDGVTCAFMFTSGAGPRKACGASEDAPAHDAYYRKV